MSINTINKIAYDKKSETLTIVVKNYYETDILTVAITADNVSEAPVFCENNHSKVFYSLYRDLVNTATLNTTVTAKFKDAYMLAKLASRENGHEMLSAECFNVFLGAVDNGSKAFTKGEYIVEINYRGNVAYHKNAKGATLNKEFAKVFKTLEHAKWEAIQHDGKVVAL